MARGRPKKYNVKEMIKTIDEYTDAQEIPILKEVCYQNSWSYDYIMALQRDNEELSQSIKRLLNKKEANLERQGLTGLIDKTVCIFSLKQLGWRDKTDVINEESSSMLKDILQAVGKVE